MMTLLTIFLVIALLVQASDGQADPENKKIPIDDTAFLGEFCPKFYDLPVNINSYAGDLERAFWAMERQLENKDYLPQYRFNKLKDAADHALNHLCVDPSTYFNPECLFARRHDILFQNPDITYFYSTKRWRGNPVTDTYINLWFLHPLLRDCLEQVSKPLAENDAKDKFLKGLATLLPEAMSNEESDPSNIPPNAHILIQDGGKKSKLAEEIEKSCMGASILDRTFCYDLPEMIRLVEAYEIVKSEANENTPKWTAYRLHFALIKLNNPDLYPDAYPSVAQSIELVDKNIENIFRYINDGQRDELKEVIAVVPVKSTRTGCEVLHILPSSSKNVCMFWQVITQIQAYLKSLLPFKNGKIKKILNTNIEYPTFLSLTEMDRIRTVVQNTENALPRLGVWVTNEVKKNVDARFRGLKQYFRKVEAFNSAKAQADVEFIQGRLNDYKADVSALSQELADQVGTILDYTFVAVKLDIVESTAQLVLAGAVLMNPMEKLFGGSSAGDFIDRAAALAHKITNLGALRRVRIMINEVKTSSETIGNNFKNNSDFLENVYNLMQGVGRETSTEEFENRRKKFLEDYKLYDPKVRRPELTGMTTKYGDLIDAACDVIENTDTTAAAVPKAVVLSKGMCPKAKTIAAKFFETMGEIYDFQFEYIEAMASYMRAMTAHFAAGDIVADYEERSQGSDMENDDVINNLKRLSILTYVSYKIHVWEVTGSYCDILAYKEGGVAPSVCQGPNTDVASLASHTSPTCRNVESYKDVPFKNSSITDKAFMNLTDLYAGKPVTFKIPNPDWLVANNWIRSEDKNSAIVVKKFELFLPTGSTTQRMVRSSAIVTGNNEYSTSGDTSYVIVPNNQFIFEYFEGQSDQPCRQESLEFRNPYDASAPKLCPLNVDENNCQELLRKTPLFPSVYARWRVSIRGYESDPVPVPATEDFRLKVGMKLCILSPRSRDKESKNKKANKKMKNLLKSRDKTKLDEQERKSCPEGQYWKRASKKCVKCPEGSRSVLGGYFCMKIPKNRGDSAFSRITKNKIEKSRVEGIHKKKKEE